MKASAQPFVREEGIPVEKGVLLEAVGLKKGYRQGLQTLEVLRGVDLEVRAGEFLVIVGPSGSGKSTLLHLLGGLDQPSAGQVRFQGSNLSTLSDRQRAGLRNRSFGFVFQFYHLVPELTALENVMLPAWIAQGGRSTGVTLRHSQRLLEEVGLTPRASHLPSELSGGEQQRVAIARALINKPGLIFCDEPTGNLDSATGQGILKLLVRLNREQATTCVIVTHEPAICELAGRVLNLRDGQLWA